MSRFEQIIRRARLRQTINAAIHRGGTGAAIGLTFALALLVVSRLTPLSVPGGAFLLLPMLGFLAGFAFALIKHPRLADIALQIDRALRLKDRMSTAHDLVFAKAARSGRTFHDAMFAELVQRDAERLAQSLDVRSVTPIRLSRTWALVAAMAATLWLGYLFMPNVAWGSGPDPAGPSAAVHTEQEQERQRVRDSIEESIEQIREDLRESGRIDPEADAPLDPRIRDQLDALDRLARQLEMEDGREIDVDAVRDEAAARLSELAEQLAEEARRDRRATETLAERFAGIEPPDTPMSAQEFQEALRRGDFGRAADLLEEKLNQRDEMSTQEREELAKHLRHLEEELSRRAEQECQQIDERRAQIEDMLRDLELDEDMLRQLLDEERLPRDELRDRLRDQAPIDEELAERLAREIERLREDREIVDQSDQNDQTVRDALREAAEEFAPVEADPPDRPVEPSDPADAADAPEPDAPAQPIDEPVDDPVDDPAKPDKPDEPRPEPGDEPEPGEDRPVPDDRPAAGEEPTEPQPADRPDPEAPDRPAETPEESPAADPDATEGEIPGVDPEASPDAATEELPAEQPGVGEDDAELPGEMEATRRPSDALRELDERRKTSREREQRSEETMRRAREMLDRMSPEERDQLAEELQRQLDPMPGDADVGASPDATRIADDAVRRDDVEIEDLDVRPDDVEYDDVLAEWLSDAEIDPRESEPRVAPSPERIREARRIAERAVEEAAVPSRYHHLIRRYFGRLDERSEADSDGGRSAPSSESQPRND